MITISFFLLGKVAKFHETAPDVYKPTKRNASSVWPPLHNA
jgi:hypothetical protein